MKRPLVGFAGMTHLGLVSGICAAEKGFKVLCFDTDPTRIDPLKRTILPISEPQLLELAARNAERLTFSSSREDLAGCDVIYVAPDIPTDQFGKSDLMPLGMLLELVQQSAKPEAVIVVLSQVPPGYTRGRAAPGRILYYQVETLVFGRAVERALLPERYIVGCEDPSKALPPAYKEFLEAHGCPILLMRYESAELAKISINMCLVASVSTANTLAELCERIGADWSEIVPALKLDRRIGQHSYLAPGLGIAGGNLERDLATVITLAELHGTDAGVVRSWIANSQHRRNWAATTIRAILIDQHPHATVAVWGLAYKENTHSIKNSPSLATIALLPDVKLQLHDPQVASTVVSHGDAIGAPDALSALTGADALLILTPWAEYRSIAPALIAQHMRGKIVLDPYAVVDPEAAVLAGLDLHTLGRPPIFSQGQ